MMLRKFGKYTVLAATVLAIAASLFVACSPKGGQPSKPVVTYTVKFDANGGTAVLTKARSRCPSRCTTATIFSVGSKKPIFR